MAGRCSLRRFNVLLLLLSSICGSQGVTATPCKLTGGRTELIVDVAESLGNAFNQTLKPEELPIEGEPGVEVDLILSEDGMQIFGLEGKKLSLKGPLDRDEDNLSILRFQIICRVRSTYVSKSIPGVVRVHDLNDNRPQFLGAPYHVAIREDTPVNSAIFSGIRAMDRDSGRNGQIEYEIVSDPVSGSTSPFSIRFPHQGVVFLDFPLDYEATPLYIVNILAKDQSAIENERLNATTTLTIRILDVDDRNPVFDNAQCNTNTPNTNTNTDSQDNLNTDLQDTSNTNTDIQDTNTTCQPVYTTSVVEGDVSGVLSIQPASIHAKDLDESLRANVRYSFTSGEPKSFYDFFRIDASSGSVSQIAPVRRADAKRFKIKVQATEEGHREGFSLAILLINVLRADRSPPKIILPNGRSKGIVSENADVGTPIMVENGDNKHPFKINVVDADMDSDSSPAYDFELTSSQFAVNESGILVVASPDLNRDPPSPSVHTFQIIARERHPSMSGSRPASSPVTVSVRLTDVNDNAPKMAALPAVTVIAGQRSPVQLTKSIAKIEAKDPDEGPNGIVHYSLESGGRGAFRIDADNGEVFAMKALKAGEKYFLQIKATDQGGLESEGFLEVLVTRGPNLGPPRFQRPIYQAVIPEDVAHGHVVIKVKAIDPDNDSVYYSFGGPDVPSQFAISAIGGEVSAVAPLDRESNETHFFLVKAEDSEGSSSTAEVLLKISDANDHSAKFNHNFTFRVDEGLNNATVGVVKATDPDFGKNGEVLYVVNGPEKNTFSVDEVSGRIATKRPLDYETQKVHYLSLLARDNSSDQRTSTTTVTVLVTDIPDERPIFPKNQSRVEIPENKPVGSLVTTVQAKDPDTQPDITYKLIRLLELSDLSNISRNSRFPLVKSIPFRISPDSGRVIVSGPLDYEGRPRYDLLIGTQQNPGEEQPATMVLTIDLSDVNDNRPVLGGVPSVATLSPSAANAIGATLANVTAEDKDGTAPNNVVKYSFSTSSAEAKHFFSIDEDTGEIKLKRRVPKGHNEIEVSVVAQDQGSPPLSDSTSFRVLPLNGPYRPQSEINAENNKKLGVHLLGAAPSFDKKNIKVQIAEGIPVGSEVVSLAASNATDPQAVQCVVTREAETFSAKLTANGKCLVTSSSPLDFETRNRYDVTISLQTKGPGEGEADRTIILDEAQLELTLADLNDNTPIFVGPNGAAAGDPVLTYVLYRTEANTEVTKLQATDTDGGNSSLHYSIVPESNRGNYFRINSQTGVISTARLVDDVPADLRPFNLTVTATDEPGTQGKVHATPVQVVIGVIEPRHRAILVLSNTSKLQTDAILTDVRTAIRRATGNIPQIEDVVESRDDGFVPRTDIWFHMVKPNTLTPVAAKDLVQTDSSQNRRVLSSIAAESQTDKQKLKLFSPAELVQMIKEPTIESTSEVPKEPPKMSSLAHLTTAEYAFIGLAAGIIVFVIAALIAICALWNRYSSQWEGADKRVVLLPPGGGHLSHAPSMLESISKEYEVQVLHMSVPLDDDSVTSDERREDAGEKKRRFLDDVSYISKARVGESSGSEHSTQNSSIPPPGPLSRWSNTSPFKKDEELSKSESNSNVLFGPRKSVIDTTTEL